MFKRIKKHTTKNKQFIFRKIYFEKCVKSTPVYTIWRYIWKYFLQNNKTLKSKHFTFLNPVRNYI